MTMIHNFEVVDLESSLNPLTWLWHKVTTSPILTQKLSKYMKLTNIAIIRVLGFMENERTFNIFSFMKN